MATGNPTANLKHFGGCRGEDLEVFAAKFRVVAHLQGWHTRSKRADNLPLFLDKGAFTVWSQLSDSTKKDDEAILDALRSAFGGTVDESYRAFVQRRLRPDEPVDVFLADLQRLLSLSGHTASLSDNPILKQQFLAGIPQEFATQLRLQDALAPLPLEKCVSQVRALRSAARLSTAHPLATVASARPSSSTRVLCFSCKQVGHKRSQCPNKSERAKNRKCYTCGKMGHLRADCPAASSVTAGAVDRATSAEAPVQGQGSSDGCLAAARSSGKAP